MPATTLTTGATTLWSLGVVREWMGISDAGDNSQDAALVRLADWVSAGIERYTRRKFVTRAIVEVRDGDGGGSVFNREYSAGGKVLFLREFPVGAFTSLTIRRSPTDPDSMIETVSSAYYNVNLATGKVWLHSDRLSYGVGNVTATYTAGYGAKDAATLPQDIVGAGLELVKLLYTEKTQGSIAATAINVGAHTFMIKPDWPKQIKMTLDDWRRPM